MSAQLKVEGESLKTVTAVGKPEEASLRARKGQSERLLVLEAGRAERNYWADLWTYRELFIILAWRDVAVQYKQTVIGIAWAVLRPLISMSVFTVVFGRLANLPSEGAAPYPVMVMAGMLPWFLFSTILSQASNSLVGNSNLISKVYFPRLIVPAASAAVALADFAVTCVLLLAMMAYFRFLPDWRLIFLPGFILLAVLGSLGPAFLLSALNVRFRDFRFIIPFIVQLGLYVSPVGFSSRVIPGDWIVIYSLNPVAGIIDGFRWCLLGGEAKFHSVSLAISVVISAFFLWLGVRTFRATEKTFADII